MQALGVSAHVVLGKNALPKYFMREIGLYEGESFWGPRIV